MSKFTYQQYVASMRGFNKDGKRQTPMDEATFNKMEGISNDTEECLPPLVIIPKRDARSIQPTHENYLKENKTDA